MNKTELLLPVGDYNMCVAAIHGGADAIYVGVPGFNARGRSKDHEFEELEEMIRLCHLYGVKVYLAFNVLIFENELEMVSQLLKKLVALSPDAFIVQDLGLVKMIREICPKQVIHGSTQMTVTNVDAIEFLGDLEIKRFVLGRENTIEEIKKIKSSTSKELEVFVHGALCVAYSGQCFTSESIGGRSANRGQCAQSCRLGYQMLVDGNEIDLGDKRYLVSPQDLYGLDHVEELIKAGVNSLKVEGRLKGTDYVSATAYHYQKALKGEKDESAFGDLSVAFSRGFFSGWLNGVDHQSLVPGKHSSHRGLFLGQIANIKDKVITINTNMSLAPGNGLSFETTEGAFVGAKIFTVVESRDDNVEVTLFNFDPKKLKIHQNVYLTHDQSKEKKWSTFLSNPDFQKKIPLVIKAQAKNGAKLELSFKKEGEESEITLLSDGVILESTGNKSLKEVLDEEWERFSRSPFFVKTFFYQGREDLFLPSKEIKLLRQKIIQIMSETQTFRESFELYDFNLSKFVSIKNNESISQKLKLNILLRDLAQVKSVAQNINPGDINRVVLDFEFGKNYEEAIEALKTRGFSVYLATTRILKPNEYYNLNSLVRSTADGFLVRNLGAFHYLKRHTSKVLIGDFSLNVSNSLSFNYLIDKGFSLLNLSYDLNSDQLYKMLDHVDPSKAEVTVYQYMPEFHMEHCVFAAFLSTGKSFRDCGHPCEKHKVELRDQNGVTHYLKADQECRNTMFSGSSQSSLDLVEVLKIKGVKEIRMEALNEPPDELVKKIKVMIDLIDHRHDLKTAKEQLGSFEKYGLSSGQILKSDSYKDRKKNYSSLSTSSH